MDHQTGLHELYEFGEVPVQMSHSSELKILFHSYFNHQSLRLKTRCHAQLHQVIH